MKPQPLTLELPTGEMREVAGPGTRTPFLSEWLEAQGIPLNMRCGGRGLCRGCQVVLHTQGDKTEHRACRFPCGDLPADLSRIQIPANSWRDQSLLGVSAFEIRLSGKENPVVLRPGIGLALDIGTTTLAGALWDFSTGRCLGTASLANGQIRYGDNVLARISFSLEHADGSALLQRALVLETLHPLITTLCRQAGLAPSAITQANAAGNPTMLHTLAGESLEGLARYPFRPVFLGARRLDPQVLGLPLECPLDLLPGLGPFVGADLTAGALASGLITAAKASLLIDFGTNGEILLHHAGRCLATATAAGPAFEGGRLSCGAPARPGVISSLSLDATGWHWVLTGGGDGPPQGISGAAYVDFIALGRREGWIHSNGRFDPEHPWVQRVRVDDRNELRVGLTSNLFVSEIDVAELLQAKAAIAAGVSTLLEMAGLAASDLDTVFVAGGFGYHLHPGHARSIGLLPGVDLERMDLIGNSSLGGASLLLHSSYAGMLADFIDRTTVVELNLTACFEDHFTDALSLPELR
jgi:uncharacterized 2Fe-2S/4Fe-4S cluster protein (DUF4445 family)